MVSRPERHPIDDATEIVDRVLDLVGPPPVDPTDTWRATFAASGMSTSERLRSVELETEGVREELTRQAATNEDLRATLAVRTGQLLSSRKALSETQEALAASQADLTAMQARYEEASAEAKEMRQQADHWLTKLRDTARDLAAANYSNKRLKAELDSALGRLNEQRDQGGEPRG